MKFKNQEKPALIRESRPRKQQAQPVTSIIIK